MTGNRLTKQWPQEHPKSYGVRTDLSRLLVRRDYRQERGSRVSVALSAILRAA